VLTHSHTRPSLAVKGGWARATCEASDHAITNRHYCPRCNNASDLILIAIEDGGAVFHARQRIPLPRACRRGVYNNSSPLRETNKKHPQQKFNKCKENIELTILDHPQHYTHCIILCPTLFSSGHKALGFSNRRKEPVYITAEDVSLFHHRTY